MAELRQNTWSLNAWYDQDYAGNISYSGSGGGFGWGRNNYGQLGQNNETAYSSPVQIPGDWGTIKGGSGNTFGVKSDGTLWSWGRNDQGQLGHNNKTKYSSPTQIPGTTWSTDRLQLSNRGVFNTFATKTDGTLWSWGYNNQGQLGHNNKTNYSSPKQIPGISWNIISNSYNGQFAIKTDGTLWSWGWNNNGAYGGVLGHSDQTQYSSPRQVGENKTWDNIITGGADGSVIAHKTDGTLWTWGYNGSGQLGQNNKTSYSSPRQVGGNTTWSTAIAAASGMGYAIKTDGTLWSWGYNTFGGLGQNNRTERESPVQIPGTTWSKVGARGRQAFATKTDGTVWAWGKNDDYGQLGQNNRVSYSSPVQIPGTNWDIIEGGGDHAIGRKIL